MDELIFILISLDEQGVCGNQVSLNDSPGETQDASGGASCVFLSLRRSFCLLAYERGLCFVGLRKEQMSSGCGSAPERGLCHPSDCLVLREEHSSGRPQLLGFWREPRNSQAKLEAMHTQQHRGPWMGRCICM